MFAVLIAFTMFTLSFCFVCWLANWPSSVVNQPFQITRRAEIKHQNPLISNNILILIIYQSTIILIIANEPCCSPLSWLACDVNIRCSLPQVWMNPDGPLDAAVAPAVQRSCGRGSAVCRRPHMWWTQDERCQDDAWRLQARRCRAARRG